VALSPIPIIAVVLVLSAHQARVNGPVFVAGWLAALAVLGAIVLSIDSVGASLPSDVTWVSWIKAAAGVVLLLVAAWQFRARPKGSDKAALPKWVARIDEIKPLPATGLGVAMGLGDGISGLTG
jgi:threonine/homoserine/homoserine lactone efflux protein